KVSEKDNVNTHNTVDPDYQKKPKNLMRYAHTPSKPTSTSTYTSTPTPASNNNISNNNIANPDNKVANPKPKINKPNTKITVKSDEMKFDKKIEELLLQNNDFDYDDISKDDISVGSK